MAGSKLEIFEYVHANTSRLCFKNSRYVSFSLGIILPLINVGRGSSLVPRLISRSSSECLDPLLQVREALESVRWFRQFPPPVLVTTF